MTLTNSLNEVKTMHESGLDYWFNVLWAYLAYKPCINIWFINRYWNTLSCESHLYKFAEWSVNFYIGQQQTLDTQNVYQGSVQTLGSDHWTEYLLLTGKWRSFLAFEWKLGKLSAIRQIKQKMLMGFEQNV